MEDVGEGDGEGVPRGGRESSEDVGEVGAVEAEVADDGLEERVEDRVNIHKFAGVK